MRPRLATPTLITLLLLQMIVMVVMLSCFHQFPVNTPLTPVNNPSPPVTTPSLLVNTPSSPASILAPPVQRKVHVLLLSSWRSGSSFLGQVFSQHPSVFYLTEPAWHVWRAQGNTARGRRRATRDLLHRLLRCDLSVINSYLLLMWSYSRALCSPPACALTPRDSLSNQTECQKHCGSRDLAKAEEACRSYSHVALKEVRLFELESLYPLLRDPTLDLRIVHLVRDPRAVWRSRNESASSFYLDNALVLEQGDGRGAEVEYRVMQEVCRSHLRMHETALLKPPDFLRGRYKMVRFEDLARDTLAQVEAIYRFTGLEMTQQLRDWVFRITHGKGTGARKDNFQITSRSAEDVARAWRTTMPFEAVQRIQKDCKDAMSLLGYRTVGSKTEQRQLDLDLLSPQEPYQFSWLPSKTTERPSDG